MTDDQAAKGEKPRLRPQQQQQQQRQALQQPSPKLLFPHLGITCLPGAWLALRQETGTPLIEFSQLGFFSFLRFHFLLLHLSLPHLLSHLISILFSPEEGGSFPPKYRVFAFNFAFLMLYDNLYLIHYQSNTGRLKTVVFGGFALMLMDIQTHGQTNKRTEFRIEMRGQDASQNPKVTRLLYYGTEPSCFETSNHTLSHERVAQYCFKY